MPALKANRGLIKNILRKSRASPQALQRLENIKRINQNRKTLMEMRPKDRISVTLTNGRKIMGSLRGVDKELGAVFIEEKSGKLLMADIKNIRKMKCLKTN